MNTTRGLEALRVAGAVIFVLGLAAYAIAMWFGLDWADSHPYGAPWYAWLVPWGLGAAVLGGVGWFVLTIMIDRRKP